MYFIKFIKASHQKRQKVYSPYNAWILTLFISKEAQFDSERHCRLTFHTFLCGFLYLNPSGVQALFQNLCGVFQKPWVDPLP